MGSKFLIQTTITDFNVLTWKSKPVFYYYDTICAFLKGSGLDAVADILAVPQHKLEANRITAIQWIASGKIQNTILSFSQLFEDQKDDVKNKISLIHKKLDNAIALLKDDEEKEKRDWAELLSFISFYPGDEFIYYDGQNVFIAAWGLNSKSKLGLEDIGGKENLEKEIPVVIPEDNIEEEQITKLEPDDHDIYTGEHNIQNEREGDTKDEEKTDQRNSALVNFRKSWWWWLLLLLLLLILGLFTLKTCAQKPGILLPDPNVIVPIDSSKIDLDKDSISYIVKDRLNIIFKNKGELDIHRFSKDFKNAFPEEDYKIIYYDTLTYRIQISTPMDKMDETKSLLKSKLSQYEMIIFQESIFNNRFQANDPGFNTYDNYWFLKRIRAFEAWDITLGNEDIVVAVLDDGFDLTHPEFQDKIYKPYNVVNRTANVFTYTNSTHGTHVAATAIGAINNGDGISGSAPNCKLMPIQVSDTHGRMSTTAIVDGILYAIMQGADIINMSFGMYFSPLIGVMPDDVQYNLKENMMKDEEAFWNSIYDIAKEYNVAIVIAGGNQSLLVGLDPKDRSEYVINVSASDVYDQRAQFSNYGRMSDVTAPGTQIYSAVPGNKYDRYDGTSMAAPLVAGGVALMKSLNRDITAEQIKYVLHATGNTLRTDKPVGRLLQLDKALKMVRDGEYAGDDPCVDVLDKILDLERQLAQLRALCPDLAYQDTLKIPENPTSLDFLNGIWKSTTPLHNHDGDAVVLYFYVEPGSQSQLRLEDPRSGSCYAGLSLQLNGREFSMDQPKESLCSKDGKKYYPYSFECEADANGYAVCIAQNKVDRLNRIEFNLIRIK